MPEYNFRFLKYLFLQIDADGDGEISFDEFSAMMLKSDKLALQENIQSSNSQLPGSPSNKNH